MKRLWLLIGLIVFLGLPVAAQGSSLEWGITAPDVATASGWQYAYYLDGATTRAIFSNVTCVASPTAGLFTCKAPMTPGMSSSGRHTVLLSTVAGALESAKSIPFVFDVPAVPVNIRIVP